MRFRNYGKSGPEISVLGLGGHLGDMNEQGKSCTDQERAATVGKAIDLGVNYFDTTWGFELESLARSLKILEKREGLFISGMVCNYHDSLTRSGKPPREFAENQVNARLGMLESDSLDQFLMGGLEIGTPLESGKALLDDSVDALMRMREQGKIKHLGFSCHDHAYAAKIIRAYPQLEAVMVPYNYVRRNDFRNLNTAITETGIACIAMKPLVWQLYGVPVTCLGHLGNVAGRFELDPEWPIAQLSLRYILQTPEITCVVPAMTRISDVEENAAAAATGPLNESEMKDLDNLFQLSESGGKIPLIIGGLLDNNSRVQFCAINAARNLLPAEITAGFEKPVLAKAQFGDGQQLIVDAAKEVLRRIREIQEWQELVP